MNITRWNELYKNNKRLDEIFYERYHEDEYLFEKNCIELLVELGEFINETKVFKYWSNKSGDKEKILEEYADVITMILTFYGELNLEIKDNNITFDNDEMLQIVNILKIMNLLYQKVSKLMENFNEDLIKDIFSYTLFVGKLLDFQEEEVLDAISRKQKIIEKRLNSNY